MRHHTSPDGSVAPRALFARPARRCLRLPMLPPLLMALPPPPLLHSTRTRERSPRRPAPPAFMRPPQRARPRSSLVRR